MKQKKFSYKINKKDYILKRKINDIKNIFTVKKLNIYFIIIVFLIISIFPMNSVEAGDASKSYTQKVTNGIASFPESYQRLLKQFVDDTFHDNWNFQAYYTGIDWNEFVKGEKEYNRVYHGFDTAHRCSCNNLASGYYCANSEITSYFMDPRNFINERNLFQFLEISYNKDLYTKDFIGKLVAQYPVFNKGEKITFVMSDEKHPDYQKEVTMTYTDIIMKAAEVSQMSPISMIIKIVQEVGAEGSASTDGKHAKYPNTYNFFNIGASDTGDAILNGMVYANNKGWHCPYTSIVEGAMFNSDNYIKAGQNTAYFYKYDCVGNKILKAGETQKITTNDLYHQYSTNVQDPYSQSASLFNTYLNNDLLDENLNFIIPVFNNMPEEPVEKISSLLKSDKELYFADISSSLYVRTAPSGTSGLVDTIYKDDLVIMLQRNYITAGGVSWDKVQLWDGDIGYTMSKYLEPYMRVATGGSEENNSGNTNGGSNNSTNSGNTTNTGTSGNNGNTTNSGTSGNNGNASNSGNSGTAGGNTSGNTNTGANGSANSENNTVVDTKPLAHIGYGYADVSTTLNVRKGAGTSYGIQGKLSSKQEVIILEETNNWYKIKYTGGEGYVSKEYVKTLEYIKVDEKNKQITIIPNINANIVAGKLKAKAYSVKKADKEIKDNSLGTGYVIKLDDKEYTIVKVGDVNGDAKLTPADSTVVLRAYVKLTEIKDAKLLAADTNKDGKLTPADSTVILRAYVKLSNIGL